MVLTPDTDTDKSTELLETVLFAQIRFHDTVSRGRKSTFTFRLHCVNSLFGRHFEQVW
jgi:hypothetical protein